uniref:Uncharacterized protein n=1 Tax=Anguilla anguilla TaxID=7936 RepID=A0A0E9PZN4_ANGAN
MTRMFLVNKIIINLNNLNVLKHVL